MFLRSLFSSRLTAGKWQRIYHRQRSRRYWIQRARLQRAKLWIGKNLFGVRGWARSRRESASIFTEILNVVVRQLLFAATLVVGLEILERTIIPQLGAFIQSFEDLPGVGIVPVLYGILASLRVDPSVSTDILTTMIQVAGVFLGLYFTAISVVASTVYARVQGDVRDLLVRERVGNYYVRVVALLGVVGTILLAARALNYSPGVLNLLLVAFLGGLSILSFVVLGSRVFNFFNPVPLVSYVGEDLAREIIAVTPEGYRWQDQSFQDYHQRRAENLLRTYGNIVHLATQEDYLRGDALRQLATGALSLLRFYAHNKSRIPSDSRWFKRTARHKEWLTSDATELETALSTGTMLLPEQVPDPAWFESRIEEMLGRILGILLQRGDLSNAAEIYDSVQRTSHSFAKRLALDEALRLFHFLRKTSSEYLRTTEQNADGPLDQGERLNLTLGIADIQGLALINILLGFSERLQTTTADSFGAQVSRITWTRPSSIYAGEFPRPVIERLEELQKGLETERALEGHGVSPLWYQQQLASLGFVRRLSETSEKLVAELENAVAGEAETLVSDGESLLAAQVISRGLEACSKFAFHLDQFEACFQRLDELRRVEDIPWESVEWEKLGERIGAVRKRLVLAHAKCLPKLAQMPRSEDRPDYFGHAYTILAEESYHAMAQGDEELFKKIFPPLFVGCLSANNRLSQQLRNRDTTTSLIFSTEPLADLLTLSGHAIIHSELHGKGYWRVVKRLWDEYVSEHPEPSKVFEFLTSVVGNRQRLFFGITPRDLVRTSWQQNLERRFRDSGLMDDMSGWHRFRKEEEIRKHESKLIRILSRGGHVVHDPHDVFLAVYSSDQPELSGLELPHMAKSLAEELAEESEKDSTRQEGDDQSVQET